MARTRKVLEYDRDGNVVSREVPFTAAEEAERDDIEATLAAERAAYLAANGYRLERKAAYVAELGQDPGDVINTFGDVVDDLVRELRALRDGDPETPEFTALTSKVADIKLRFPKPE